jgi:hypothetical protein
MSPATAVDATLGCSRNSNKGNWRNVMSKTTARQDAGGVQRFSLSLPPLQNEALNAMAEATSLSKTELVRQAVALLSITHRAREKGLKLALVNDGDDVVSHIVSTV